MGLIHSRAAKKRNKEEARLLREQRHQLTDERQAGEPWYQQRTLGRALARWLRDRPVRD